MKWRIPDFVFPRKKRRLDILVEHPRYLRDLLSECEKLTDSCQFRFFYMSEDGLRPLHLRRDNLELCEATVGTEARFDQPKPESCSDLICLGPTEPLTIEILELSAIRGASSLKHPEASSGLVSVIIPTYKRADNLERAVESVLNQDYDNIEVIIVSDNGDGSPYNASVEQLVAMMVKRFPSRNIRAVFHQKNRNGAAARNTGLFFAKGEYICFLDDDDVYLEGRISSAIRCFANQSSDVGCVMNGYLGWNSPQNDDSRYTTEDLVYLLASLEYKKHYIHTGTITYRRELLLELNGFDEFFVRNQDLELNLRTLASTKIAATYAPGIRLKPQVDQQDNRRRGKDYLKIKSMFFSKFSSYLANLDEERRERLLENHRRERAIYCDDNDIIEFCKERNDFLLSFLR
jgi:glycosyltransferase involved in cell wall biosynthesis